MGIIEGVFSYVRGFKIISRHRLWSFLVIPFVIILVLTILILSTAYALSDNIGDFLVSWYTPDWGRTWIERIAQVFGGLFVAAIGFVFLKSVVFLAVGPFMSRLSYRVQSLENAHISTSKKASFLRDNIRSVRLALRNLVRELLLLILLFLLGLIPFFAPISVVLIFIVQSYYAGFGNMDFTLERYCNVRESIRFVRKHWGFTLGNGAIFMLLTYTGLGLLLAIPLGVAGVTLSVLRRLDPSQV